MQDETEQHAKVNVYINQLCMDLLPRERIAGLAVHPSGSRSSSGRVTIRSFRPFRASSIAFLGFLKKRQAEDQGFPVVQEADMAEEGMEQLWRRPEACRSNPKPRKL